MDGNQLLGGPPPPTTGENGSNEQQQNSAVVNEANKRAALAGQWRTPPLPIFPSVAGIVNVGNNVAAQQTIAPSVAKKPSGVDVSQLPDSTEDYAKALQEAYQRGAEAAQAMAAQKKHQHIPPTQQKQPDILPSTSCPDFVLQAAGENAEAPVMAQPQHQTTVAPLAHPGAPPSLIPTDPSSHSSVPNPLSMPPPAPVVSSTNANMGMMPMATLATAAGPMGSTATARPSQQSLQPLQPLAGPIAANLKMNPAQANLTQMVPATTQRSMSLPDMSTYAAQQEEEKRQKRLARNRASARLRRLRKKNLVEAYEQEVGILEKTLAQLQAHEWGETDNVAALTEALSMDRGQQVLTFEQRHEVATGLLDQQLQWIEMLEEIMLEDYVLQNVRNGEFAELKDILGLDEEQLNRIEVSKVGWQEEWTALQTLKASVIAMRENDWLWNESVSSIAEQFMAILHKNQVSKFLLWADHNAEAIDELDGVNAAPGPANGPVFAFGVESQPGESFGDEEK